MLLPLSQIISKYRLTIRGVIHVGAHFGEEHDDYLAEGINDIVYVEACKPAFEILQKAIKPSERVKLFNTALADYQGETQMFVESHNKGQSNSMLKPGSHLKHYPLIKFEESETVPVDLLDNLPIDRRLYNFMNIDVQGAELMVLKGSVETLKGIDYIYTECNREPLYEGCPMVEDIDKFLKDFTRVETKWVGAGWGDALYVRKEPSLRCIEKSEMIVDVPEKFRPVHPFPYPPDNFIEFERWFFENVRPEEIGERIYLPIFWTAFYVKNKYGRNKIANYTLQQFIKTLDRSKKYFTICQYDDGILNDLSRLDVKVFGMSGGKIDYTLPLICQPHKFEFPGIKKDIFCSYIGQNTHSIRRKIINEFQGKEDCYISDKKHNLYEYCKILARSKFVLAPRGYGKTSFRIMEALQYNAMPVYVSDIHLKPHGIESVPMYVNESEIPLLYDYLKALSMPSGDVFQRIFNECFTYEANKSIILKEANK